MKGMTPLERARKHPRSRDKAISAKCYECVGEDCDPGWHRRIRECSISTCPLHRFRPYQGKKGDEPEQEAGSLLDDFPDEEDD